MTQQLPREERLELVTCGKCGGEGGYEQHCRSYVLGCGFAHDDSTWMTCEACNGKGEFIRTYELEDLP